MMCSRMRAEGFYIWGSSQCPSNSVPSKHSYSGYAMADRNPRNDFLCVQRTNTAVARSPCEPLRSCPPDGSVSTFFKFDRPGDANDNDFVDRSTGEYSSSTTPASQPWTFADDPTSEKETDTTIDASVDIENRNKSTKRFFAQRTRFLRRRSRDDARSETRVEQLSCIIKCTQG